MSYTNSASVTVVDYFCQKMNHEHVKNVLHVRSTQDTLFGMILLSYSMLEIDGRSLQDLQKCTTHRWYLLCDATSRSHKHDSCSNHSLQRLQVLVIQIAKRKSHKTLQSSYRHLKSLTISAGRRHGLAHRLGTPQSMCGMPSSA